MTLEAEKRISPRKTFKTRVVFEDEFSEGFLTFLTTDISLSGIFIESEIPLQVGTRVFLKFSLHEGDASIQVSGVIARLIAKPRGPGRRKRGFRTGIGIRFVGLKPEDLHRIERFVIGAG